SPALTRLIRQSLSTLAHDNHAVVLESRSPPEIYQSPAGFLSAGLFLCPKSIEGDQLSGADTPYLQNFINLLFFS
ncbi:hypothetical protein KJ940_09630, partial [Myxococcota bacterium]|nr:hypothetical protein [Myxococcota bacterium]